MCDSLDAMQPGMEDINSETSVPKNSWSDIKDRARCRLLWMFSERGKIIYGSYKDFKKSWDPETKVWKEIKKEIKSDFKTRFNPYTQEELGRQNRRSENMEANFRQTRKSRSQLGRRDRMYGRK